MNESSKQKHLLLLGGRTDIYEKAKHYNLKITLIQEKNWMVKEDYDLVDRVIHAPIDAPYLVDLTSLLHDDDPFDFVFSFLEAGLLAAAMIQDKLKIEGNPLFPVEATRFKSKMRETMVANNIPSIPFSVVDSEMEVSNFGEKVGYPIILKSARGSGSRNIHKLKNDKDINQALSNIKKHYPNIDIIAEKFIDGKEISVESFTWEGKHSIVAMTDKLTTGYPYFVEVGHTVPSTISDDLSGKVKILTEQLLNAINQEYGPSHTEIIIENGEPYIIESHTRTGGSFIFELVENVYGVDFFSETLKRIAGYQPEELESTAIKSAASGIRHFLLPKGKVISIKGTERVKEDSHVTRFDLMVKTGSEIEDYKNSDERYGYIQVIGDSIVQVNNKIETLMNCIEFEIEPEQISVLNETS